MSGDVTVLSDLLDQMDGRIDKFLADGAYDGDPTYQFLIQRPQSLPLPEVIVPPRGASLGLAKAEVCCASGTAMSKPSRIKPHRPGRHHRATIGAPWSKRQCPVTNGNGPGLRSRDPAAQKAEAMMSIDVLNHMFKLGKPVAGRIGQTEKAKGGIRSGKL